MFLLAIDAQLPVVPVTIHDSRHVMTKGRLMVRPGAVTLTLHEPIVTAGLMRDDARALAERVQAIVAAEICRVQGSRVRVQEEYRE
jgi:1-acyl-sn-glycerol-3-phosphate acyltransferase